MQTKVVQFPTSAETLHRLDVVRAEKAIGRLTKAAEKAIRNITKTEAAARDELEADIRRERTQARRTIARELRDARNKLGELQSWETDLKALARQLQNQLTNYPSVPYPIISPSKDGKDLPENPGVYFLWNGGVIEYIGQAIKLNQRLRLGYHHILTANHAISFLLFPFRDLTWAECYYIGIVRPMKNFGTMGRHNQ